MFLHLAGIYHRESFPSQKERVMAQDHKRKMRSRRQRVYLGKIICYNINDLFILYSSCLIIIKRILRVKNQSGGNSFP